MHVAPQYPKYNPYPVCTKSTHRKGIHTCTEKYEFEDFDTDELRGYAKMKKIKGAASMSRSRLVNSLYQYAGKMRGKPMWQDVVSATRSSHPELSFKQAVKLASKRYQAEKKK
jgi:hypothetical protein